MIRKRQCSFCFLVLIQSDMTVMLFPANLNVSFYDEPYVPQSIFYVVYLVKRHSFFIPTFSWLSYCTISALMSLSQPPDLMKTSHCRLAAQGQLQVVKVALINKPKGGSLIPWLPQDLNFYLYFELTDVYEFIRLIFYSLCSIIYQQ